MKKTVDKDDEIKVLSKYKNLSIQKRILICMYILIILTIISMILPYVVSYFQMKYIEEKNTYDTSSFKNITRLGISNLGRTNGKDVLFICSENYQECHDFINTVNKAQSEYNFVTYYLKADELNNEEAINSLLKFDNDKKFIASIIGQIPIVLVLSEEKLVEGWVGVSSYENYLDFLKKCSVIK